MAKQLTKIELNIVGTPDEKGVWGITASADLTVGLEEYPEWEVRKGMVVQMTPAQENIVKNFVKNVVLPQAEIIK